ncbi:hypothetical protein P9D39_03445 [Heyndrickxia oleronia]|uniref:Uncharacterized protein n=1 Tax=Heyndrickxia oleronia TaxID=38875 RepID=A0A8E2I493_9BACI|nr:hypothetical protein [Heyndrickxia oleronia]MEC1373365.1 hypothetical protein [Heyndrickxia oleronia]NYV63761.1 hypothetical protein [Bacillus sp. Gen3]OOP65790.1 hypothetical protein BWZ43_24380 [Heyndrickxia oleronia]QQZ04338.1 hypothetical protein I5818_22100 [Heyndrickxia oleronia]
MTVFNIYKLNDNDQLDLFFSKHDGSIDLQKVMEKMEEFTSPNENGVINGEGFLKIRMEKILDHSLIESFATGRGSLGYYNQAYFSDSDENVTSQRREYSFFSKARIFLTEDNLLIIFCDDTAEEKIKSNVKNLVESLGFDVSNLRLSDKLMRKVRSKYKWNEVRLEKVDNEKDSTKKVYYEIDTADSDNESLIDQIYKDQGKMVQISFEMPSFEETDGPNLKTVKLYKNDNRIVLNSSEFSGFDNQKNFVIFLSYKLIELENEED